ncbi:TPR repeat protein [Bradyrhizobium sp. JR6.1]
MTVSTRSLLDLLRPGSSRSDPSQFERGLEAYENRQYLEALRLWRLASRAGNPEADYRIGLLYARNEGVIGNIPDAVAWYERAALNGHTDAQFQLGLIYFHGFQAALGPNRARDVAAIHRSAAG